MLNYYFSSVVPLHKPVYRAVEGAFPSPFGWSRYQQYNKGGNFFEDIWNSTTSFISNPISYTGDRLAEIDKTVIQPVYREVIQPVGKVLEGVGKAIANDPITFVATVAAVATGNAWMVPIIQGVSTAAHGGNVEDVVKTVAISAATTWVGGQIGEYVSSGMQASGGGYELFGQAIEKTTAATIGNVVGYSASGAIGAAAMGKNGDQILTTALANGAGAALPLVLGNIPGYNDLVKGTVEGIAPDVSKAIANGISGVAGSIVGAAITGKDVTAAAAAGIISAGIQGLVSTKNMVTDMFKGAGEAVGISNLSTQTQAIIANTMSSVFATALNGGKAGNILQQVMLAEGNKALQSYITDGIKSGSELVSNLFKQSEAVADQFESEMDHYVRNIDVRNGIADQINNIVDVEAALAAQYDQADNQLDAYLIKSQGYQQQYDQKYSAYQSYVNQANALVASVNAKGTEANNLAGTVNAKATSVNAAAAEVNRIAANVNAAVNSQQAEITAYTNSRAAYEWRLNLFNDGNTNAFANTFDRNFYLQQNPDVAAAGVDPYEHFIQYGYNEGRAAYPNWIGNLYAQVDELNRLSTETNAHAAAANDWATKAEARLVNYNNANTLYASELAAYNQVNGQYQTALREYNNLKASHDSYAGAASTTLTSVNQIAGQLNQTNTLINQTVSTLNGINAQITGLNNQYTNLNGQLTALDTTIKSEETTLIGLRTTYDDLSVKLTDAAAPLTQQINELTSKITKDIVAELDPSFDAEQYKQINGLGAGVDAATHWLSVGKDQGLYTNNAAADAAKYEAVYDLATQIAKQRGYASGFDVPDKEWAQLYSDIEAHYGNNINAIKNATPTTLAWETGKPVSQMLSAYDESKLAETVAEKATYGAWNAPDNIVTPNGTKLATAEEYATGKATAIQTKDGNIAYVVSDGTQSNKVYDKETGEMVDSVIGWNTGDIKNVTVIGADGQEKDVYVDSEGNVVVNVSATSLTPVDPMEQDPLAAMYTFNTMDAGLLGDFSKPGERIIEGSKAIIAWAEEKAKTGESSNVLAIASNVVGGFGEQFQSFAGLAALVGTQPETTDLYKLGQKLIDLQKSSTPADFAKRYEEFQAQYQSVTGLEKGWAFVKAAVNSPSEFLIGMAIPEIAQELIPTLVGVATGGMSKVIGTGGGALATVAPKVADWVSKWGGVAGSAVTDVVESFGANYNDTYSEAKTLAAKAHPEWSKQQIEEYATQQGLTVGMVGALTTGISMGLGGAALAKSLLGPKATDDAVAGMTGWLDQLATKMTDTGKIMLKEGVSEAVVEEIPTQLVKDILFLPMDPNRDIAGNLSLAGAQAFMTSAATTGSISAAHQATMGLAELALNANDAFMNAINGTNGNAAQLGNVLNQWLPTTTTAGADLRNTVVPAIFDEHPDWALQYATAEDYKRVVATLGVKDPVALTELVDKRFDTAITTSDELATELYNKGLTDVTVKDIQNVLGTGTQTTTQVSTAATNYVNANMVSQAELQAAATQEGYVMTQADLNALVGRGVQAEVIQKFIQEIDPKAVTTAEATQYFKDLGYTPATATDIAQFVKSAPEAEVQAAVAAWVDPRQVTRQEAIDFYKELNYVPTEAEINQYVVQGPQVAEANVQKQLATYVDPRYTTIAEVKAAALREGYTISDEEAAKFVGQYMQTPQEAAVQKFSDPLAVLADEAKQYFASEGYTPSVEELQQYTGVRNEADTAKLIIAYADPLYMTNAEAKQYMTELGYTAPTAAEVTQFVKQAKESDVLTALQSYVDSHQVTRTEAINFFANLGYTPTEAEIANYIKQGAGISQDDIKNALGTYADPKFVSADEVRQAFKDLGLAAPVSITDIARLTGQYSESQLAAKAKEALPVVSSNAVYAMLAGDPIATQSVIDGINSRAASYIKLGMTPADAQTAATNALASQYGVTSTKLLTAIGTTAADLGMALSPTTASVIAKIEEYQNRGMSTAEATQAAIDTVANSQGVSASQMLSSLGTTADKFSTYVAKQANSTERQLAELVAQNELSGLNNNAAIQKAVDDLSASLGTTRTELLNKIDVTSQQFQNEISVAKTDIDKQLTVYQQQNAQQLTDVQAQIQAQMTAYEQAGIDRDTALSLAISGVAQNLGTTRADLLTKIGTSETALRSEFTQQTTALSTQVQDVAKLLGKPVSQVTANDITAVKNMLAGQTQTNLAYDINQDGKVDINDQVALERQLAIQNNPNIKIQTDTNTGQQVLIDTTTNQIVTDNQGKPINPWSPAAGTPWAPTGVYEELDKLKTQQTEAAKTAVTNTKKQNFSQMMQMVLGSPDAAGRKVTVDTPPPSKINYLYDFSSIFATPQQAGLFPSPYGAVNTYGQPMQQAGGLGSLQTGMGGQAANQSVYGAPYKMAVGGFAEGGMIGNNISVGDGNSVDDLLNILKGNSG